MKFLTHTILKPSFLGNKNIFNYGEVKFTQ